MSFLEKIKGVFGKKESGPNKEELHSYLNHSKESLRQAEEYVTKFLEGVKGFQPARRHEELFQKDVKEKLAVLKNGISKGVLFLDSKITGTVDMNESIRSLSQLNGLLDEWIRFMKKDDENANDLLKTVTIELWGDERIKRGFPAPKNKDILMSYLDGTLAMLKEAKQNIETYEMGLAGQQANQEV